MAIIEPLSFGHTVELALSWGFQVGNPIVVLPLKQLLIELGALFLPVSMILYRVIIEVVLFFLSVISI